MSTGVTGVFGCYELRGLLGRGGMGEVYRAYDTRRGREVALKLLAADPDRDPTLVERFRREARTLVRLSDPYIVPVHDFGEIGGRLFIDMALVEGRDLAGVLATGGPMPPERALRILGQAAQALDTAHRHGLVHRDVKPSNLLILTDRGDFTYLVDFGIAHAMDGSGGGTSLTGTGATIGTWAYIAPEQIRGQRVDGRADVYALTCVLFEMLTGRRPFDVDGTAALLHAHLDAAPPRVTDVRRDLPSTWDDVVARGMAKDPADRPASAGALYELARSASERHRPTAAVPAPRGTSVLPPVPPSRPRRSALLPIAVTTVVAAVLVVAGVLAAPLLTRNDPAPASGAPVAAAPVTVGDTGTFRTYRDPGWGYSLDVPQALPDAQPGDDGVRFTGAGTPATLRVTGRVRPAGTPEQLLADALSEATAGGGRTTYSDSDTDSFTGSGLDATGTIFYFHSQLSDGAVVTASWSYPVSEKATWDAAVTRSTTSLRFG